MIHNTLLKRKSQKAQLRLNFFRDAINQAATSVTAIAGH